MKIEKLSSVYEAINQGKQLSFVYIREYSRVAVGVSSLNINKNNILELRYFQAGTEIRVIRFENGYHCVKLTAEGNESYIEHTHEVINPTLFGEKIKIREYFSTDDDGQTYVAHTCLAGWEGENCCE